MEKIAASKVAERSKSKSPTKPEEKVSDKKSTTKEKESQSTARKESPKRQAEKSSEIPKESKEMPPTPNKSETAKTTVASLPKVDVATTISTTNSDQTKPINTTAAPAALPSSVTAAMASASPIKDNAKRPSLKRHKDSIKECKPLNVLVYAETATARESAINILKEILAENT